jgi:glutamate dehydrogenase (NADP+)
MDNIKFVTERDPYEKEFHQAVTEVIEAVRPVLEQNALYRNEKIMERVVEPERVIMSRSHWLRQCLFCS